MSVKQGAPAGKKLRSSEHKAQSGASRGGARSTGWAKPRLPAADCGQSGGSHSSSLSGAPLSRGQWRGVSRD